VDGVCRDLFDCEWIQRDILSFTVGAGFVVPGFWGGEMGLVLFPCRLTGVTALLLVQAYANDALVQHALPLAPTSKKLALVVGVSHNANPALPELEFAATDARAVAAALEVQGFSVETLTGAAATRATIEHAITNLRELAGQEDTVLFYFSGHGVQSGNETYIAPYGANPEYVSQSMVSVAELYHWLARSPHNTFIVLDACQTGPRTNGLDYRNRAPVYTLYSTQPGNLSYESEELRHGVFTHHLLNGLRGAAANKNGGITWQDLVAFVVKHVAADTRSRGVVQVPYAVGPDGSDVTLGSAASSLSLEGMNNSTDSVKRVVQDYATVFSDVNPSIEVPLWQNTIDKTRPISHVKPVAVRQGTNAFFVSWTGTDVGAGVQNFTVYVSDHGGPFTPWQQNVTGSSALFTGHTYSFYSMARDVVDNVEIGKNAAEAITSIVTHPSPANDRAGSARVGGAHFVSKTDQLRYSIYFEHVPMPSAPAHAVVITDQLNPNLIDLSSLSLGPITLANKSVGTYDFQVGQGVAPGSYVTLFGSGLSDDTDVVTSVSLPLSIHGVSVSFDVPSANISALFLGNLAEWALITPVRVRPMVLQVARRTDTLPIATGGSAVATPWRVRPLAAYSELQRHEMLCLWEHAVRMRTTAAFELVCSAYPGSLYCVMAQQELDNVQDELRPKAIATIPSGKKDSDSGKIPPAFIGATISIIAILVTINLWVLKFLVDTRKKPKRLIKLR
jgi:hypothetical protein